MKLLNFNSNSIIVNRDQWNGTFKRFVSMDCIFTIGSAFTAIEKLLYSQKVLNPKL